MKTKHILLILALLSFFIFVFARVGEKPWVERNECVVCGDCTKVCPTDAVSLQNGRAAIDPELCINCKFCVQTCTYRAIRTSQ